MRFRMLATIAVLILTKPFSAHALDPAALSARVDSLFSRYGPETPGVSIRVLLDGKVVHRGDYGMANLEHRVPVTDSTVFDLGSVSKQFTGLAIAMLADRGRLDLDADVHDYVPEVPDFGKRITVRQLLHHTSGIRDWVHPFAVAGWHAGDVIDFDEVMEYLKQQRALNFEPGERYRYSNTGYALLAEIVHRVTDTDFAAWMRDSIFVPLGMDRTRIRTKYYELVPNFASSYYPIGDGYGPVPDGLTAYGSSCVLTTADDMVRWLRNDETGAVGSPRARRSTRQDTVAIEEWDGRLVGYGYGVDKFRYHGHVGWFHSGQWVGMRAATLVVPDRRFAVVALSNAGPSTNLREWEVMDLYLGVAESADPGPSAKRSPAWVRVGGKRLEPYVGLYDLGEGDVATVSRTADTLFVKFIDEPEAARLHALSPTVFQFKADGDTMRFVGGEDGSGRAMLWRGKRAPRRPVFAPSAGELQAFTGTFYSHELEGTLRFSVEDGRLVARNLRWGDKIGFTPTVKDEFRGDAEIRQARFVRDGAGEVRGVDVSVRRAANIRFVKIDAPPRDGPE